MRSSLAIPYTLFLVTACGASKPSVSSSTTEGDAAGNVLGPPDVQWAEMDPGQKGKFMKAVVVPHMKKLFVEFDREEFDDFSCATCHGKSAKNRAFKMPSPEIDELPRDEAGFAELMREEPAYMKFMGEQVKPQMAKLLGLPEFDPKSPQPGAFGCSNCHTTDSD